tara:strand:- start:658 stop:954 length:297 start_codon:yes stop_codon:yes gene_type:complete
MINKESKRNPKIMEKVGEYGNWKWSLVAEQIIYDKDIYAGCETVEERYYRLEPFWEKWLNHLYKEFTIGYKEDGEKYFDTLYHDTHNDLVYDFLNTLN